MRIIAGVVAAVAVLVSSGCAGNPWARTFRGSEQAHDSSPVGIVQVRVVTMDQIRQAARRAEAYLAERKLAPEDMSPEDAAALRSLYLDEFRLRADAASMIHLGTSAFTASRPAERSDPRLLEFARRLGATHVFLATEYAGRGIEHRATPVWSYGPRTVVIRGRDGKSRVITETWSTTTWVPVPVEVDRFSHVTMFYRAAEERPR